MLATERRPILLANGRILDPSRNLDIEGDLLIADGLIREAKRGIGAAGVPENTEIIDCRGNLIAPGLIDIRAFVGEPGAEYRETIASASQAAARGGSGPLFRRSARLSPAAMGRSTICRGNPGVRINDERNRAGLCMVADAVMWDEVAGGWKGSHPARQADDRDEA